MARLTRLQEAGLNLLDRVLQNQILVDLHYSQAERDALQGIGDRARQIALEAGLEGLPLERAVHWSLALLELWCADSASTLAQKAGFCGDVNQTALEYVSNLEAAFILALADKCDAVGEVCQRVVAEVVGDLRGIPATVRHRLTERVFAVEFPDAPIEVLAWLCESKVVVPAKFRGRREERSLAAVSLRAVSLWELDGIRAVMPLLLQPKGEGRTRDGRAEGVLDCAAWLREVLSRRSLLDFDAARDRANEIERSWRARAEKKQAGTWVLLEPATWDVAERVHVQLRTLSDLAYWNRGVVTNRDQTASPIAAMMLAKYVQAQPARAVYSAETGKSLAHEVAGTLALYGITLSADTVYRTYTDRHKANMEWAALYYELAQSAGLAFPFSALCPYQVWTAVSCTAARASTN